jgi:cytochrome o ubiquinol oxidase subunit 1
MTMLIAVPTGVKIFNWLFTMHRGRILFTTPMLWFLGFVLIFTIGGMTGVMMSIAPIDFQVHNSLFLIAHFHSVIIGGVVFAFFAAFSYWFPKISGFKLNERLGRYAFWSWMVGFILAFMPLYALGLMGATRRLDHYDAGTGWQPLFIVAAVGVAIIFLGIGFQVLQVYVSIKGRHKNRDTTGDPWNGRTLEWSTPSPPQEYNFAIVPHVHDRDAFWTMKHARTAHKPHYEDIIMPKNTPLSPLIGGFAFLMGFCLIWHIMWLAAIGLAGIIICMIVRLSEKETEHLITAKEVAKLEGAV